MANPVNLATPNPLMTSGGVGASPGYSALDVRRLGSLGLQEGVFDANDFKVSPDSGMDLAVGAGEALVQGDIVTDQGLYYSQAGSTVTSDLTVPAADATNPRIDQVVLEVKDDTHDASGLNLARLRVVTGTPTSGATLDNRTGAASLPSSALRLADVLVGAGVSSISANALRDRRSWARGAHRTIKRVANAGGGSNYTTTSTSLVAVDSTNLAPRIECSGLPIRFALLGTADNTGASNFDTIELLLDSAAQNLTQLQGGSGSTVAGGGAIFETRLTPVAGSHVFSPAFKASAGTAGIYAQATAPLLLVIEEIVRQDSSN